jgi:DNA mismatch repair protein MutS
MNALNSLASCCEPQRWSTGGVGGRRRTPAVAHRWGCDPLRRTDLAQVVYLVRVKGPRVEVSRYDGEPDYSAEIEATFERFRQGAVKDYRVSYRSWPSMNHVGERILDLVARLFGEEFGALADYCDRHASFLDPTIARFDREVQFYLAYLDYIRPLRGQPG